MNNTNYTVDVGVPLPSINRGRKMKYPFDSMKEGDSFFIAEEDMMRRSAIAQTLRSSVAYRKIRKQEVYTVAIVDGGVRCWRMGIADRGLGSPRNKVQ